MTRNVLAAAYAIHDKAQSADKAKDILESHIGYLTRQQASQ